MKIMHTNKLSSPVYKDSIDIRKQVFIEEQKIAETIEIDQKDSKCLHFVLYESNLAVATCRLLPLDKNIVQIQRMAVLKSYRKKGIGKQLLQSVEKTAQEAHYSCMQLHAQWNAVNFYQSFGYRIKGDPFYEADIKHILMHKEL